jgi:hypothetical protein
MRGSTAGRNTTGRGFTATVDHRNGLFTKDLRPIQRYWAWRCVDTERPSEILPAAGVSVSFVGGVCWDSFSRRHPIGRVR